MATRRLLGMPGVELAGLPARLPEDFMFQLTAVEAERMVSQSMIPSMDRRRNRYHSAHARSRARHGRWQL